MKGVEIKNFEIEDNFNKSINKYKMKYIVYLTINIKNYKKYIGVHKTKDPDIFDGYIGCGVYRTIPSTYKKSKTAFQYAVNKYGVDSFKRITLAIFDDEESAYNLESLLVTEEFIRRDDVYNTTCGGHHTDRSIKCYQYDLKGNYMRNYKSYQEAAKVNNCSDTAIRNAILYKRSTCNSLWTNNYIETLNLEEYTIYNISRPIYEYNSTGEYIQEFESVNEIIDKYGISRSVINRGIQGQYLVLNKYYSLEKIDRLHIKKQQSLRNKPIFLYSLSGEFYKEFKSPTECAKFFNDKSSSSINSAIRLNRVYKGYQVSLDKVPYMKNKVICTQKKPVIQYDLNNNFIKEYPSKTEAIKEHGTGVAAVLKGQQANCHHFIFKYKES